MEKDFTNWHELKTNLQKWESGPYFSEREIWLCSVGLNLGHEEDGKGDRFLRPVIIFKKFTPDVFWAIPLTSSKNTGLYYYQFNLKNRNETAILFQIRLLDRRRLLRRMAIMPEEDFFKMTEAFNGLTPKIEIPPEGGISRGAEAQCDSSVADPEQLSNIF